MACSFPKRSQVRSGRAPSSQQVSSAASGTCNSPLEQYVAQSVVGERRCRLYGPLEQSVTQTVAGERRRRLHRPRGDVPGIADLRAMPEEEEGATSWAYHGDCSDQFRVPCLTLPASRGIAQTLHDVSLNGDQSELPLCSPR